MRRRVLPVPVCLFSVVLASMFASTAFAQYARVSIASDGTEANFSSVTPSISDDGRFVAFSSAATNLVTGDTNGRADVYLHDRDSDGDSIYDEPGARTTVRVSITTAGEQFGGSCFMPVISGNGRFVAFLTNEAMPPSLPGGNGFIQILRWDRLTGAIVIVTQVAPGVLGNGNSASPGHEQRRPPDRLSLGRHQLRRGAARRDPEHLRARHGYGRHPASECAIARHGWRSWSRKYRTSTRRRASAATARSRCSP